MKALFSKFKLFYQKLKAFFPSPLPVGVTAFNEWAASIISLYGLPDNDTTVFTLGTMIMHYKSTSASAPKRYFGTCVRKAMANQIAASRIQEIKAAHDAKMKAEQEAAMKKAIEQQQKPEVTLPQVTSNGPQQ